MTLLGGSGGITINQAKVSVKQKPGDYQTPHFTCPVRVDPRTLPPPQPPPPPSPESPLLLPLATLASHLLSSPFLSNSPPTTTSTTTLPPPPPPHPSTTTSDVTTPSSLPPLLQHPSHSLHSPSLPFFNPLLHNNIPLLSLPIPTSFITISFYSTSLLPPTLVLICAPTFNPSPSQLLSITQSSSAN